MPETILAAAEHSGYISIIKLIVFLALFFPLPPLLAWVFNDAEALEEKGNLWMGIILAAAAAGIIIWLLVPIYAIGLAFYVIAVGITSIAYIKSRNTRVLASDRVLTADHIRGLFGGSLKKSTSEKKLIFVTANKNEVPVPEPKTPDLFGYKTALDLFTDIKLRRANNIIFSPAAQDYNVIYYIDGVASKQPSFPKEHMEYLIRFVKNLGDLDVSERRKPQKGLFKIREDKDDTEWEVLSAGSTTGEHLQIRQRMQQNLIRLEDIGLTTDHYEKIKNFRNVKQGIFIISGSKKSGITTTLYALLRNHDAFLNNINTLETEISAQLPNITQQTFQLSDTGTTTYAKKLQAMIRMGPDIVGVAKCEDPETAKLCCSAAEDSKLIYLIIEADSVLQALEKWIKLVADKKTAVESLLGISNQRLVRKLCDDCKQAYMPDKELLRKFNISAQKAKPFYRAGKVQYDKHGKPSTCETCQGTGFLGRMGAFEIIFLDKNLKKAIIPLESLSEIGRQFRHAKMRYLQEQTLRKVITGKTSINEMVRVFSKNKKQKSAKNKQKPPAGT